MKLLEEILAEFLTGTARNRSGIGKTLRKGEITPQVSSPRAIKRTLGPHEVRGLEVLCRISCRSRLIGLLVRELAKSADPSGLVVP